MWIVYFKVSHVDNFLFILKITCTLLAMVASCRISERSYIGVKSGSIIIYRVYTVSTYIVEGFYIAASGDKLSHQNQ